MVAQGTFRVEADQLDGLGRGLDEAVASMGGAISALTGTQPRAVGHQAPEFACGGFGEGWSFGLQQLGETLKALGGGLQVSPKGYRQADEAVRRVMSGQVS
ncbi:hypothetical protein J2S46_000208 [Kitasatospora herbaricolor]|uniref:hypothetical protein n=1 Tax=Kitasatospora herbaricolor TaxID=68217 RepID=UPI00174CE1F4|nr:hypothetical protein [Kitasatospora herbaricolor]MDQ0305652.1 hypothetical protein [Kitasatospora herbaricolor]